MRLASCHIQISRPTKRCRLFSHTLNETAVAPSLLMGLRSQLPATLSSDPYLMLFKHRLHGIFSAGPLLDYTR